MTRMITFVPNDEMSPKVVLDKEVKTKDAIHCLMSSYGIHASGGRRLQSGKFSSYSARVDRDHKFVYVYHAEKRRRKVEHVPIVRGKHNKKNYTNPEDRYKPNKVRDSHWRVRVFKIPMDRIIEVKQLARTFKAVLKQ